MRGESTVGTKRMTRAVHVLVLAALAAGLACGADPAPAGSGGDGGAQPGDAGPAPTGADGGEALGVLAGHAFTGGSAAYFSYRLAPGAPLTTQIVISDRPDLCALVKAGQASGSLQFVGFFLQPQAGAIVPGSYSIGVSGSYFAVGAAGAGPACAPTFQTEADSGSVSLAALSPGVGGRAAGSFDLVFPEGRLRGAFDAPFCDAPLTSLNPCGR